MTTNFFIFLVEMMDLKEKHEYITVPMIFQCNRETHETVKFVGGCSDLKELFEIEQCQPP